jgi:hypothetical protein
MQIWRCPTWFETRKRRSRLLFSFANVIAKFSSLKFEYGFFFWEFSLFFAYGIERQNIDVITTKNRHDFQSILQTGAAAACCRGKFFLFEKKKKLNKNNY